MKACFLCKKDKDVDEYLDVKTRCPVGHFFIYTFCLKMKKSLTKTKKHLIMVFETDKLAVFFMRRK